MMRSMKEMEEYTVATTDGDIGHVKDCYFDDATWVIRYWIVDTAPGFPVGKS